VLGFRAERRFLLKKYVTRSNDMPRTLQISSTGDDVKFLQEQLNAMPPTALPLLDVDGDLGPKTLARVQEYQGTGLMV
jgi:hypothetical protein